MFFSANEATFVSSAGEGTISPVPHHCTLNENHIGFIQQVRAVHGTSIWKKLQNQESMWKLNSQ